MKSFRKRPRSEWRQVVKDWQESGLSVREFCRRQGVAEGRFYSWRKRFGLATTEQRQGKEPSIKFLPVQIKESSTAMISQKETLLQRVEVFLSNGSVIRFSGELSNDRLSSIMSLAAGATC